MKNTILLFIVLLSGCIRQDVSLVIEGNVIYSEWELVSEDLENVDTLLQLPYRFPDYIMVNQTDDYMVEQLYHETDGEWYLNTLIYKREPIDTVSLYWINTWNRHYSCESRSVLYDDIADAKCSQYNEVKSETAKKKAKAREKAKKLRKIKKEFRRIKCK